MMKTPKHLSGKRNFPRILKNGMVLLFCSALFLTSCSKDNDSIPEKQQPQQTTFSLETESYGHVMDSLYGKGNYEISKEAIKVTDNKGTYYVEEVSQNKTVRGYLINIDYKSMIVFLDHHVSGANVDEINYYSSPKATPINTDLTENDYYLDYGFNYQNPTTELGNPFWGDVDRDGEPYDCGSEGNDCTCTAHYTDHYIFWINVGTTYNGTTVDCE